MKLWDISGDGGFWKVQSDVRDLGGHLDLLGELVLVLFLRELVASRLGSLPLVLYLWWFHVKLGLVRGKYLPAGLHAAEASCISSSAMSAFRAAIVRAVWSSKMPLANAPAILNLLDGPVGIDPAFQIIWA